MIAGEDVDAIKDLARYQSPADLMKAFKEQRAALSRRAEPVKLPDNPTPEQVTAYRKAQGVPDVPADATPDKIAEAYGIKAPDGYEMSETEKGMIGEFAKTMHGKHAPPGLVKEATDYFFKQQHAINQAIRKDAADKAKTWKNGLVDKHGTKEYEAQQAAATEFMRKEFADNPDEMTNILQAVMPGGGRLGDHPWFFEMMAKQAMGAGFTDRIEANALESGGKSLLEQRAEIERLMFTDRQRYDQLQPKLQQINRGLMARGEIDENGDPVRRRSA